HAPSSMHGDQFMRTRYGMAAAVLLAGLGGAQDLAAQPQSAYLGVGGGAVILPEETLDNGIDVKSDTRSVPAGRLGLRWQSGWRVELEGAHRENDATVAGAGDKITSSSITVNAIRDLDMGWKFLVPYVGAGVGAAQVKYELPGGKKDTGGMWQL